MSQSSQQFKVGDKVTVEGVVTGAYDGCVAVKFSDGGFSFGVDPKVVTLVERPLPEEPGIGALIKIDRLLSDEGASEPFYAQRFNQGWYLGSERRPRTWAELHARYPGHITVVEKGWRE